MLFSLVLPFLGGASETAYKVAWTIESSPHGDTFEPTVDSGYMVLLESECVAFKVNTTAEAVAIYDIKNKSIFSFSLERWIDLDQFKTQSLDNQRRNLIPIAEEDTNHARILKSISATDFDIYESEGDLLFIKDHLTYWIKAEPMKESFLERYALFYEMKLYHFLPSGSPPPNAPIEVNRELKKRGLFPNDIKTEIQLHRESIKTHTTLSVSLASPEELKTTKEIISNQSAHTTPASASR
ncbi:hypothetical protein [Pelagicoccus sp. SDUM812003]|uniref:hypothetical protein n=1 Tax=Pelagicoccus sp. SDUM812003 TaxID=3041267 RepID=UPI00280D38E2|nr:hypothetical protein [Pelagicoccus sp. SDUM812003]MDQ8205857.1 hypothetical protein [Pelagicoccus sp. SDUM812003]